MTTVELTLLGALVGWTIGTLICLLGLSKCPIPFRFSRGYVHLFRGIPFLVLCMLVYYGPSVVGLNVPSFLAGVLALALNTSAFCAEILRGGLNAVSIGQIEAAESLGYRRFQYMVRIILPEVFVLVIPQLLNELTIILKNSSLVMVISVVELMFTAQQIVATNNNPSQIYLLVMVFYVVIIGLLSRLSKWLEARTVDLFQ